MDWDRRRLRQQLNFKNIIFPLEMGVPKFYYQFLQQTGYPHVTQRGLPPYVSSLLIDFNSLIHESAQLVYAYGEGAVGELGAQRQKLVAKADPAYLELELHNAIANKILQLVTMVQPREILVLAVDGVAPAAKINQQRQRRYRAGKERKSGAVFDSNAITPGTDFMFRLDSFLSRWVVSSYAQLPPKVVYSGHLVAGEGEHKIMDLIRNGTVVGDGAHVLYGMDSDLVMLSLIAPLDHIFLMREDVNDVININNLRSGLREDVRTPTVLDDFVVFMFLLGNDFLPHQPSFGGMSEAIQHMLGLLRTHRLELTRNRALHVPDLLKFLELLEGGEPQELAQVSVLDTKHPSRMFAYALNRYPKPVFDFYRFRNGWYANALGARNPAGTLDFRVDEARVVEMATFYLQGMQWIYQYYKSGMKGLSWEYVYPYFHTPLLGDVASVLRRQLPKLETGSVAISPLAQLLTVLPPSSFGLLPKELKSLTQFGSPILDIYPSDFEIEMDGFNSDWQGLTLVPPVEIVRVIEAVRLTSIPEAKRQKYDQGEDLVLNRTPEMEELRQRDERFNRLINQGRGRGRGGRGGYQGGGYQSGGRGGYQGSRGRGGGGRGGYQLSPDAKPFYPQA